MSVYRTDIIAGGLFFIAMAGAVIFYLSRMDRDLEVEQTNLYTLILPEPQGILSVNKPVEFCGMLKRQPQLERYFREILPEELFQLLCRVKFSPVLFVYYPQGVVMYFQQQNKHDDIGKYVDAASSYSVKKDGIDRCLGGIHVFLFIGRWCKTGD